MKLAVEVEKEMKIVNIHIFRQLHKEELFTIQDLNRIDIDNSKDMSANALFN